ncbi:MAG: hypothetical protein CM1200mP41_26630 [Gammaproteobacteria bacterium]|nr:MAG: hypothetical protein CM1200mP41_26630 [Gammaproteobacteria bacterium]
MVSISGPVLTQKSSDFLFPFPKGKRLKSGRPAPADRLAAGGTLLTNTLYRDLKNTTEYLAIRDEHRANKVFLFRARGHSPTPPRRWAW